MVAVRHDELVAGGMHPGQQIEEDERIETAGHRHDGGPWGQREGLEPGTELVEEIHPGKLHEASGARPAAATRLHVGPPQGASRTSTSVR